MKYKINLEKVYRERVKPNLTKEEAEAMERAFAASKECKGRGSV